MKLQNKEKEIEVTINVPTRTARKTLRGLDKKQADAFNKLNKKFKDVLDLNGKSKEEKEAIYAKNEGLPQKTFDYVDGVAETGEEFLIKQFQAIVRADKLEEDDRKLVMSEPGSDFWMEQNLQEVGEAVASFRGSIRPGRPENQKDT